jgi:hypothetical protein
MRHVRRLTGNALRAAALVAAAGACGHRGDPRPPLRHTPPSLQEFRLAQRGGALEVSVLAPSASVDGIAYESLSIEFLFVDGQKDLLKAGARREVIAVPGARVVETLPLPAPGTVARAAARGVFEKEKGPRTLTMALIAQAPVVPPRELAVSLSENGVRMEWAGDVPQPVEAAVRLPRVPGMPGSGPASGVRPGSPVPMPPSGSPPAARPEPPVPDAAKPATSRPSGVAEGEAGESEKEEPATGFLVYRRVGSAAYAGPLTPRPLEKRLLRDATAPLGEKVCYVVRAVASLEPLVESAASNEACLDVRDIAPPAAPTGLAVLPREKSLELVWTPSTEEDLALYRVYREAPGEPRRKLAEVDKARAGWSDETARPGVVYQYALTAVDRSGNESPATPAVEGSLQ